MEYGSETLATLIKLFARLPGIGHKTAQRLALHLLRRDTEDVEKLGALILELKQKVKFCGACGSITEDEKCAICTDPTRSQEIICVVEEPQDVLILEKTGQFSGLYHVLHGVLSPMDGVGPADLTISQLEQRVKEKQIREIILALSTTMEGDTTNFYIYRQLQKFDVKLTTIARGISVGDEIEFADEVTLGRSIVNRVLFANSLKGL